MNNNIDFNKNDFINLRNDISHDPSKFKNLSQKERKILKVAIENFKDGEEAVIPEKVANKLSEPSTYEKSILKSIGKAIAKFFNRKYIDSDELSNALNALNLDDTESESSQSVLDEVKSLEKSVETDIEVEKFELDEPEVAKNSAIDSVPVEKPHTVNEANRVMWKILGKAKAVEGTGEIVIAGQVLADGKGDWAAMRNMHKTLSKKFPDRPIRIIASSAEKWDGKLDTSNIDHLDLVYFGNNSMGGEEVPLSAFPIESEILKKAQDASVLITGGVSINDVFESVHDELKEKSIKMWEHDFKTTISWNDTELGNTALQAGLNSLDDRMGVFANSYNRRSDKKDYTWSDISSPNLLSSIFGAEPPDADKIEAYQASHECFFGYTNEDIAKQMFIEDAVLFTQAHSPNKKLDICIPGICTHELDEKFFKSINSVGCNIGKVHFVWFEGAEKKEKTLILSDFIDAEQPVKEIRIIDPGTISSRDFKIMTKISGPIVACTGDNSLAQAISYGKIPCYEPRFPEKFRGLIAKMEEVLKPDSVLLKYCKEVGKNSAHKRDVSCIEADGIVEEAKKFGEHIRQEANLKPVLNGVVNEKLLRQEDPDFARKQDELMQKYLDGSLSSDELSDHFTALLSEKGLL